MVIILGAGESGTGAALLAQAKGFAPILVSDKGAISPIYKTILEKQQIDYEEHTHEKVELFLTNYSPINTPILTQLQAIQQIEKGICFVVKSPGISDNVPIVEALKQKNIPIISEIEFGSYFTEKPIIAITGSNGKTTTTSLTHYLFKEAGLLVGLGGNIGESFAKQVISNEADFWVLEVSSFQLDNCYLFKPKVSMILNVTPDHLDRYKYDFQLYVDAKYKIIQQQDDADYFIYYQGNEANFNEIEIKKIPIKAQKLAVSTNQDDFTVALPAIAQLNFEAEEAAIHWQNETIVLNFNEVSLSGKHNAINAVCAVLACLCVGADMYKIRKALQNFPPVAHRLEKVAVIQGVTYINDSKATNVDAVFYALDSIKTEKTNIIWIAGGIDKGNDYTQIEALVKQKVKLLIALGKDNQPLKDFFGDKVPHIIHTESIVSCLEIAQKYAEPQDVVLLSPACASFDLFKNYEDRGNQFKEQVEKLKKMLHI